MTRNNCADHPGSSNASDAADQLTIFVSDLEAPAREASGGGQPIPRFRFSSSSRRGGATLSSARHKELHDLGEPPHGGLRLRHGHAPLRPEDERHMADGERTTGCQGAFGRHSIAIHERPVA